MINDHTCVATPFVDNMANFGQNEFYVYTFYLFYGFQ